MRAKLVVVAKVVYATLRDSAIIKYLVKLAEGLKANNWTLAESRNVPDNIICAQ